MLYFGSWVCVWVVIWNTLENMVVIMVGWNWKRVVLHMGTGDSTGIELDNNYDECGLKML